MRYGLLIDLKKCIGCNACTVACKVAHAAPPGVFLSKVLVEENGSYPHPKVTYLPTLCMHCEDAPCVAICPTAATKKREDGIVTVDPDACIGCRSCMAACPYGARTFLDEDPKPYFPGAAHTPFEEAVQARYGYRKGIVVKCDLCVDRVDEGKEPACVQSCITGARVFGDLDDPQSQVAQRIAMGDATQLAPERGTKPSVYYVGA